MGITGSGVCNLVLNCIRFWMKGEVIIIIQCCMGGCRVD